MITTVVRRVLLLALVASALLQLTAQAWLALYTADEILNLDAVLTFFRSGDYTTKHLGGFPFDPAVSTGLLATWPAGLGYRLTGSLYGARLVDGALQLAAFIALVAACARRWHWSRENAAVFALSMWSALLLVGDHELRVTHPGELWGATFLLSGVLALRYSPRLAALCWGLAAWLCKIVYLPFALPLLLVALTTGPGPDFDSGPARRRRQAALVSWFLSPLIGWLALVAMRHDLATATGWLGAAFVFVTRHATGLALEPSVLPGYEGWRFEPTWTPASFLARGSRTTIPILLPLALGPLAYLASQIADRLRDRPSNPLQHVCVSVMTLAVCIFGVWFLLLDPTQWTRHLLPASYVSLAVATVLARRQWNELRLSTAVSAAFGLVLVAAVAVLASRHSAKLLVRASNQASYASACRGGDVTVPPCRQDGALAELAKVTKDTCGARRPAIDQACLREHRARLLEHAAKLARAHSSDPGAVTMAGYMMVFVQRWAYPDTGSFLADLRPLTCRQADALLRLYLRQTGLAVEADAVCG